MPSKFLDKLAITLTPPIFLILVLAPSIFFRDELEIIIKISKIINSPLNLYLGVLIFILGAILYTWTILLFAKIGKGTQAPFLVPTQKLIIFGPYKHSRNPMVSGVILFIAGFGLILNSLSFIVAGLIIPLSYLVFIKLVEEKKLEARFGKEYIEYKNKTPFLFPKLR